jgi:hypothetical protein
MNCSLPHCCSPRKDRKGLDFALSERFYRAIDLWAGMKPAHVINRVKKRPIYFLIKAAPG